MDARLRLRPLRLGRPAGAHPRPRAHAVGPRVPVRSEDRVRGGNDPRRRRGDRLAGASPCRHRRRHRRHRDRDPARVHRRTARLEHARRGRQRIGIHRGAAPADRLRHRRLCRGAWESPHRHPLHQRSRHSPSGPSAGALRPSHRIASTRAAARGAPCPARRRVMSGRAAVPQRRSGRRARGPDDRSQRESRGHREEHIQRRRGDQRDHSAHPHEGIAARSPRRLHPGERFPRDGDRETPFSRPDQCVCWSGRGSGPVGHARRQWEGRRERRLQPGLQRGRRFRADDERRRDAAGPLSVRRLVLVVAVAAAVVACGDPNTGVGIEVIDAHVVRVIETGDHEGAKFQRLAVQLDGSLYRGEVVKLEWDGRRALNENGFLAVGDRVLLTLSRTGNTRTYTVSEIVRLPSLWPFVVVLALALVAVGRWKGIASLAGLGASIAVFLLAVLPAVRNGGDPLLATLIGSIGVLVVAVFVVHGFNRTSVAALVGTLGTLVLVVALAAAAIRVARITGLGTEDGIFVLVGTAGKVDMPRLVLAGVVVASLGALVDMAVGQASTAFELSAAGELRGRRLYLSALNVGRDHIGSLVNTLALAYFGGALPLIVLVSLGFQPLSVSINSEEITQSILAVLIASIGLVLCVPLTTAVATYLADRARPGS